MRADRQDPFFIVGAARSGTTLLQSVLNAHTRIAVLGELHFFDQICRLRKWLPEPVGPADIVELRRGILSCHATQFIPGFEEIVDLAITRLGEKGPLTYARLFAALLDAHRELSGKPLVGEKTPTNIRYLRELVETFPGARIIHLLRDPRDSISSRIRYPYSSKSVIFNTLMWKIEIMYALDFKRTAAASPDRYLELRYEDLTQAPEREAQRICAFLGVNYEAAMVGDRQSRQVYQNEPWKDGVRAPLNPDSISAWKERLTQEQVALIERVAGPYIEFGGYRREAGATGISVLAEGIRDLAGYLPYKVRESVTRPRRKGPDGEIDSDSSKLNAMLMRAIFDSATPEHSLLDLRA